MKALILNGSPKKIGPTAEVANLLLEKAGRHYDTEKIDVYGLNIKPCIGCHKCRPNGTCALPADDGHVLGEKIAAADLLIIATPCYWGNIPAPLKALFDRNVVTFEHFLKGKPTPKLKGKRAILAVTSGSGFFASRLKSQATGTIQALKTVLTSGGIKIIKTFRLYSAWNLAKFHPKLKQNILNLKI